MKSLEEAHETSLGVGKIKMGKKWLLTGFEDLSCALKLHHVTSTLIAENMYSKMGRKIICKFSPFCHMYLQTFHCVYFCLTTTKKS